MAGRVRRFEALERFNPRLCRLALAGRYPVFPVPPVRAARLLRTASYPRMLMAFADGRDIAVADPYDAVAEVLNPESQAGY